MGKLFILLIVVYAILFILFLFFDFNYDICFRKSVKDGIADENGCCGLAGFNHNNDYLQYGCIGCPYLKNIDKD